MIKIHYVDGKDFSFQTCECEFFSVTKKSDGKHVLRLYDGDKKFIKAVNLVDYFAVSNFGGSSDGSDTRIL